MVVFLTADEFMRMGLERVGFNYRVQQKVLRTTNLTRFKAHYGSNPVVYAQIWEDLQTTTIPEARIPTKLTDPDCFLMAIKFLKCYPTEQDLSGTFKRCDKSVSTFHD